MGINLGGDFWPIATIIFLIFCVGIWTFWRKKAPRFTIASWVAFGLVLAGTIGVLLGQLISTGLNLVGNVTGRFIGVGAATVVAGLALIVCIEVLTAMSPIKKFKNKPQRWHAPLGLLVPTVAAAGSVPFISGVFAWFNTMGV